jgi:hypothetical protein
MQTGLAFESQTLTEGLDEGDSRRLSAAGNVARALVKQGRQVL